VTVAVYLLLRLVQQSRAALLLRGVLVLSAVLFIITIILPLPAFDWLVRGVLLAILLITPIIFQPELRRLLERIGRHTGFTWDVRQTAVEQALPRVVRAVERMSASKTGALIAMEGNTSLQNIAETGVAVKAQITSELLQSIFYSGSPLHDGAVIIREDTVVAAGCVLPLTERPLYFRRRLGTRHRAAVGLSETTDALAVVVSEETGNISVARGGNLHRPLDVASLRKHLIEFYAPDRPTPSPLTLRKLAKEAWDRVRQRPPLPDRQQLMTNLTVLLIAVMLSVAIWYFIIQTINPAQTERIEGVPLEVTNQPAGTTLVTSVPETVTAVVRTTASQQPTLSARDFDAVLSLAGMEPGFHSVAVTVETDTGQVQILEIEPQTLDLQLASIISRTVDVSVSLIHENQLSRAYQVLGPPEVSPAEVEVKGPEPLVNQVAEVQATLSLANASVPMEESRPVQALDETGQVVTGVSLEPSLVEVTVPIRQRINAKNVSIRVDTEGGTPTGYWISSLEVTPASVTLQGSPAQLEEVGSFINTVPVNLTNLGGDTSLQVPLDLPPDLQAVNNEGNIANTVTVNIEVSAREGSLTLVRPIKVIGTNGAGREVTVTPEEVRLILSGPVPRLNEIEADPDLIQVVVDVAGFNPGQTTQIEPTLIAPEGLKTTAVPPRVEVTVSNGTAVPAE
jgi:diadenylate cyclase